MAISFRHTSGFGRRIEYWIIGRMLKEGLDVSMFMCPSWTILGSMPSSGKKDNQFIEVQIKARSATVAPGGAALFAAIVHEQVRGNYYFVFYLFVDQMALRVDKLHTLLKFAASRQLPLIVVGAERDADWGTYGGAVTEDFSPKFVRVGNLSTTEIEGLLDLLERHDCLGLLKQKRREDQVKAFTERADRQLLVALHELTQGKPFEEILFDWGDLRSNRSTIGAKSDTSRRRET